MSDILRLCNADRGLVLLADSDGRSGHEHVSSRAHAVSAWPPAQWHESTVPLIIYGQSVKFVAWAYQTKIYWAGYGSPAPSDCISVKVAIAAAQVYCAGTKSARGTASP